MFIWVKPRQRHMKSFPRESCKYEYLANICTGLRTGRLGGLVEYMNTHLFTQVTFLVSFSRIIIQYMSIETEVFHKYLRLLHITFQEFLRLLAGHLQNSIEIHGYCFPLGCPNTKKKRIRKPSECLRK